MTASTTHSPEVRVHATRADLGAAAGHRAAAGLREALADGGRATLLVAAAPSQEATLRSLAEEPGVDWTRVDCWHMDDYVDIDPEAPQGFGAWLLHRFVDRVPGIRFHRMPLQGDPDRLAKEYAGQLPPGPFDVVLLGLGVNGHLAFNDPPARFDDPEDVRVVSLDEVSRRQQVDEGHFPTLQDVPERAITLTIPRLLRARRIIASVPGAAKRQAGSTP